MHSQMGISHSSGRLLLQSAALICLITSFIRTQMSLSANSLPLPRLLCLWREVVFSRDSHLMQQHLHANGPRPLKLGKVRAYSCWTSGEKEKSFSLCIQRTDSPETNNHRRQKSKGFCCQLTSNLLSGAHLCCCHLSLELKAKALTEWQKLTSGIFLCFNPFLLILCLTCFWGFFV